MLEKIMRRYAMSREGAKGFINSVCACTVSDLVLMFPVGLLYCLTEDMLSDDVNGGRILFYIDELSSALKPAGFAEVNSDRYDGKPWITVIARK